ncbi:MAG TPA: aspartyl protease family protein [Vicinamibacterales bacterium]|nr:aspartyl protease family protein [Vicinamibacterales bacterium]
MRKILALATAGLLMASAPARAENGNHTSLPVEIDSHGGVTISVSVNGAPPVIFLLDTGTARTVISQELAAELTTTVVARTEVVTAAGVEAHDVVRLRSLSVGPMTASGLLAPVVPARALTRLGKKVRGLLGSDFLSAFNYTLDYRHRRLSMDDALACNAPGAVPLTIVEGRPVLEADGEGPLRLVPDTGAEATVLFDDGRLVRHVMPASISGVVGTARAGLITISRLRVGSVALRDVAAVIVERKEPAVDGLMATRQFASLSFAAGARCMLVR